MNNLKIKIGERAGFCFGVQRAFDMTQEAVKNKKNVYCWGDLVHNPVVMEDLKKQGLKVIRDLEEFPQGAIFVVRSHGVALEDLKLVEKKAQEIINTTCPFVIKAQNQAKDFRGQKDKVLIFGDKEHIEVKGINSRTGNQALIVKKAEELDKIEDQLQGKIGIVCQTTQKNSKLQEIIKKLEEKGVDFELKNTICSDTTKKQEEVLNLSVDTDVLLVIGGLHSSNTTKLAEIGRSKKITTYHIERAEDISNKLFKDGMRVFITAGASTPRQETLKAKKILEEIEFS
jgi:4-hydroxy-3-methylbut-2-enyl diphosphate reductase